MSRPTEHGGGQAGPPIVGDPSTFSTDTELDAFNDKPERLFASPAVAKEG